MLMNTKEIEVTKLSQHPQHSSRAGGAARSAPGVAAHYPHTKNQKVQRSWAFRMPCAGLRHQWDASCPVKAVRPAARSQPGMAFSEVLPARIALPCIFFFCVGIAVSISTASKSCCSSGLAREP